MSTGEQALDAHRNQARRGRARHPFLLFFRQFCQHPAMIGSVIPSSDRLIRRMLAPIDWAQCRLFVEYGPGVGTFTRPVLDRLGPEARLVAIDPNPSFIAHLEQSIADPRLILVNGSAADVGAILASRDLGPADHILSGLPFSTLPPGVGATILRETHAALRTGGSFIVYQFAPKVVELMQPHFARIDRGFELFNIPPARLFWGWKG